MEEKKYDVLCFIKMWVSFEVLWYVERYEWLTWCASELGWHARRKDWLLMVSKYWPPTRECLAR